MIIKIKIDTEHLGDAPEIQLNGQDVEALYHIDFDWTTSQGTSLPSTSKLNIKMWPDYMHGYHNLEYWKDHLNDVIFKDFTWETASHQSVKKKDDD